MCISIALSELVHPISMRLNKWLKSPEKQAQNINLPPFMEKPSLPKGTRDFGPATMAKRQFIFKTIRGVFEKFGFQPLETPAMENLSTLTGKYGEEGDQLLFRILDSGNFFSESAVTVAKASHYLIQSIRHITYELFLPDKKYINVEYLQREELDNSDTLYEWLKKYYHINILHGDMVETLEYDISFLLKSEKEYHEYLKAISTFLVPIFKNGFIDRDITSKEDIDHYLDYEIINNYHKLYSIIAKVNNLTTIRNQVAEKGLRYDLTVPFARYVVMNRNEVSFPFKRYQIQPVWRADRPQKGRYREFYQCDADVVGTNSLICEAEIILMIRETFQNLGIKDYSIKINHRGILNGVAEAIGAKGNETALFVAIDKLDKIGEEKVKEELRSKGFTEDSLTLLFNILNVKGTITNKMAFLATKFEMSPEGQRGLRDLREVFNLLQNYQSDERFVDFDITLARGLSYYTGCIFEVKINNVSIGSVSGGGRYDNLTAAFGDKENLSGVGFSFGVDRIYDAMEELQLFPKDAQISSKVLICHFDEESMRYGLGVLTKLRDAGIASEIYPDQSKIKKQLDYANKKMIPYAIVIGSEEIKSGELAFKDMEKGEQEKLPIESIVHRLA